MMHFILHSHACRVTYLRGMPFVFLQGEKIMRHPWLQNAVTACEWDEPAEIANLNIEITKQADFGVVVKQVQEMQAVVLTAVQCKLLSWHYCLSHLPFNQLLSLAQEGRIPKHLVNCQVLMCPTCLFGKMMRKPWRPKGKDKRKHMQR